jgi:hypothetical protein
VTPATCSSTPMYFLHMVRHWTKFNPSHGRRQWFESSARHRGSDHFIWAGHWVWGGWDVGEISASIPAPFSNSVYYNALDFHSHSHTHFSMGLEDKGKKGANNWHVLKNPPHLPYLPQQYSWRVLRELILLFIHSLMWLSLDGVNW